MPKQYRHRRTANPANSFPTLEPGELAVNTANRQIAMGDADASSVGVPMPVIAVRFFDARASYAINDMVVQAGKIYKANAAIPPGAFNASNWTEVGAGGSGGGIAEAPIDGVAYARKNAGWVPETGGGGGGGGDYLPLTGGTLSGDVKIVDPAEAWHMLSVGESAGSYVFMGWQGYGPGQDGEALIGTYLNGAGVSGPLNISADPLYLNYYSGAPVYAATTDVAATANEVATADWVIAKIAAGGGGGGGGGDYLPLTGGTLTGPLVVNDTSPNIEFRHIDGNESGFYSTKEGLLRWAMNFASSWEDGGNLGSNLTLTCFDDDGSGNKTVLSINRGTGMTHINNGLQISGAASVWETPTDGYHIANKDYVDAAVAAGGGGGSGGGGIEEAPNDGSPYVRKSEGWSFGGNDFYGAYGGSLYGQIYVTIPDPALFLNRNAGSAFPAKVNWLTTGSSRFSLVCEEEEMGDDTGSALKLVAFNDDGATSREALKVTRATGLMTVIGDPVDDLGIATKAYVDAHAGGGGGGGDYLPLTGGTLTGALTLADGTTSAPSMRFASAPNVGFSYSSLSGGIAAIVGGAPAFEITSLAVMSGTRMYTGNGTAAAPAFSFNGQNNKGMWSPASNQLGFSVGGVNRMMLTTGNVLFTVPMGVTATGTASAAAINFGTTFTGFFGDTASVSTTISGTVRSQINASAMTLTVPLVLPADPVNPLEAATKQYVDSKAGGGGGGGDYLPLTGGTLTGALTVPAGTAGAPALFINSVGGWFSGAGYIAASLGGTGRLYISSSEISSTIPFQSPAGTVAEPAFAVGLAGNGFSAVGPTIVTSIQGVQKQQLSDTLLTSAVPIVLPADPTSPLHAATKQYVDSKAGGGGATANPQNYIINGGMQISQELGDAALTGAFSSGWPADQWFSSSTSMADLEVRRINSLTPGGSLKRLRVFCTAGLPSVQSFESYRLEQVIEAKRTTAFKFGTATARQVLLRFGIKGPAGTYAVGVSNTSGGAHRTFLANFTIAAGAAYTDTVQTIVIPGDVTGDWSASDFNAGMRVGFDLIAGSTTQGVAGWQAVASGNKIGTAANTNIFLAANSYVEIFDVGLYLDPASTGVAPSWALPDEQTEILLCQRYFRQMPEKVNGFSPSADRARVGMSFPAMRQAPSVLLPVPADATVNTATVNVAATSTAIYTTATASSMGFDVISSTNPFTAGQGCLVAFAPGKCFLSARM